MRPFAVVRGALVADALADLRREADALAAKTPPTVANGCVLEPVVAAAGEEWRADRAAYAAARRETCVSALFDALPRLAAAHLGGLDRVFLFNDHFVVKPARSDVAFRWHRDVDEQLASFAGPRRRYVSCWCPLDDVDEANGCLVVRFRGEELPLRCAAGDVVLLSDDCEHASGANGSAFPRRALYAQYSDGAVGGDRPLRLAIPVDVSRREPPRKRRRCDLPAFAPDLDAAAASARTVLADVDAWRAAAAATAAREHARAVEAWDGVRDVAWAALHGDGAHWRAVPVAWRRCYAVAAFYAAWSRGEQGEAGNAVACADLGLMLSDAFHRPALLALVDLLEARLGVDADAPVAPPPPRPPVVGARPRTGADVPVFERPSVAAFERACYAPRRPALLTGCMAHWPALTTRPWASFDYLRRVAGHRTVPVERGAHYLAADFAESLCALGDFLGEVERGESGAYLAQHALFDQVPRLARDVATPDYCCLGGGPPTANAWLGGRTKSPLHHDRYHNLLAQVVGSKYVRLYAPEHSAALYPRDAADVHAVSSRVEDIDDAADFPAFAGAPYVDVVLEPGDLLYIPPHFWHYVESREPSFSVSFWWAPDGGGEAH